MPSELVLCKIEKGSIKLSQFAKILVKNFLTKTWVYTTSYIYAREK